MINTLATTNPALFFAVLQKNLRQVFLVGLDSAPACGLVATAATESVL